MEGEFFTSFLPRNEAKRVSSLLGEAISKGKENLLIEFQFITKSKDLIWIEQNTRLLRNSEGDLFATAVARDITEEKNAKVDLKKSESKYQRIIENMELGLMEVDLEGRITKVYDKFCELSGFSKTELVGQKADDMLLAPEFKALMAQRSALRREGVSEVYEMEMLTKNKERLVVLISGAPIFDAREKVIGSIGIHYNITQRKKNEDALRKAHEETKAAQKAESKFLAKVSHEIKTPINAILGLAHLLSASEMSNEQLGFANDIKSSSLLLNNLISEVLDVNAINSGVLKVKNEFLDFHDLLRVQQKMFQLQVGLKPIEIHLDLDDSVPRKILSDYNLLNRSLMSILENAVKFTDAGLIKIIASQVYKEDSTFLRIDIQDTGIGIEASELPLVFERFYQVQKDNGELSSGTGLGLNIAKEYIELLGGTIEVESTANKGTLFSVFLPLNQAIESGIRPLVKKQVFSASGRVLVVEDNEINRTYCSRLLSRWGLEYQLANDGQEAMDWLDKESFDLVLMDVQMPNVDGIQATIHTRHFTKKDNNRKIPIIGVSTFAQESDVQRALEAGMNDHIAKPYSPDELEEKLNFWLPSASVPCQEVLHEFEFDCRLNGNLLKEFYGGDLDYVLEMFDLFLLGFSDCKASIKEAILV
ncbi:MAG: PAS domain S-box protein, partial [Flavobacteriales bacterium]